VKELGLWENTMIIVLSDHGVPIGEHGIIRKVMPWPYEELSRAVLIIRHPEGIGRGRRIKTYVETIDIMPTILDFLKIDINKVRSYWTVKPSEIHGKSLLPLMSGEIDTIREFAISGHFKRSYSIRWKDYTLCIWPPKAEEPYQWGFLKLYETNIRKIAELYRVDRDFIPPPPKDFNLRRNIIEKVNIIEEEKDIAKELEVKLRKKIMELLGY